MHTLVVGWDCFFLPSHAHTWGWVCKLNSHCTVNNAHCTILHHITWGCLLVSFHAHTWVWWGFMYTLVAIQLCIIYTHVRWGCFLVSFHRHIWVRLVYNFVLLHALWWFVCFLCLRLCFFYFLLSALCTVVIEWGAVFNQCHCVPPVDHCVPPVDRWAIRMEHWTLLCPFRIHVFEVYNLSCILEVSIKACFIFWFWRSRRRILTTESGARERRVSSGRQVLPQCLFTVFTVTVGHYIKTRWASFLHKHNQRL